MSVLPQKFYHGSPRRDLERLRLECANDNLPLGRGIYLTADPLVAQCYSRNSGQVYLALTRGSVDKTINIDAKWDDLSAFARSAIVTLFMRCGKRFVDNPKENVGDAIDRACPDIPSSEWMDMRNAILSEIGIWMIYGHIDASLASGLCDRGPQYVVLHENAIELLAT